MQTMTIGRLARAAGVNIDTIRYYERHGLLPQASRRDSGYREYAVDDVARLSFIRRAKELGFSLADIAELLSLSHDRRGYARRQAQRPRNGSQTSNVRSMSSSAWTRLEDVDRCVPGTRRARDLPHCRGAERGRRAGAQITASPADSAAAAATDPVCGMTVDPGAAASLAHGDRTTTSSAAKGVARASAAASEQPRHGCHPSDEPKRRTLDLPHASRDPPRRAGRMPDLRDGARAARADGRGGR